MENKKTFGAYIQQRRHQLGMTQREFAEKLYVTESAVSKWERGLSYPDITLLRTICQVLQISEHELLTSSVDTEARATEKLAGKYRRLTRNYRLAQYILFGAALLGCAIGNLCAQHTLSWFFIVLSGLLLAASITLLPSILSLHGVAEKSIGAASFLAAFASLLLLLGVCCVYTHGSWFFVAASGVWLGVCIVFVPFLLPRLPLPACLAGRKASVCLTLDLASLLLLLAICCIHTHGSWFAAAAVSVIFGLGFFLLPVFLRQLPLPGPLHRHKTLLYFAVQTLLLFALLAVTVSPWQALLRVAVPSALLGLCLPWAVMLFVRYLPANGFFRAGAACGVCAVWTWLLPWALDRILVPYYGPGTNSFGALLKFDLSNWSDPNMISLNVLTLIIFGFAALAAVFLTAGAVSLRRARRCAP